MAVSNWNLDWNLLLSGNRRKPKGSSLGTAAGRMQAERDYDRILFAAPTRRLADKTQVFPMEENDSVRTRLTHSHEVSNLARSIGVRLAFEHPVEVFGAKHDVLEVKRIVPAMLAAIGLAHDLGNPPFGHQGESSMQQWFRLQSSPKEGKADPHDLGSAPNAGSTEKGEKTEIEPDFLGFDGNAQTLRLVARLQVLNDDFGLNLTVGTLAALIKYPTIYGADIQGYKKWGVFKSEEDIAEDVWRQTGLGPGIRHPLTVVMEACDDIAYSVIDAEDTIKKGYASFYDLMDYIESETGDDVALSIVKRAREDNKSFKSTDLSSKELNDVSTQKFRAIAISEMVTAATESFVQNIDRIMSGQPDPDFELIKSSRCGRFCKIVKDFDKRYGFRHRDVLRLELQGHNYIHSMMDMLWAAVREGKKSSSPFERFVYGGVSENYRRVFEASAGAAYNRRQLVCDAVSGMTETYLIKKHDELRALVDV